MSSIVWLFNYVLLFLFQYRSVTCSSSVHNSSARMCHTHDYFALLQFKNGLKIIDYYDFYNEFYYDFCRVENHTKTVSWRNDTDCCKWDGVLCNPSTGRVTKLDLSCSRLNGTIGSGSSLFLLDHLQSLNLAGNDFSLSHISPNFSRLPFLKYLNLSFSGFSGRVPLELVRLSQLTSLDLSGNNVLEMPNLGNIIRNLTQLRQLHLDDVHINSVVPQSLTNLSSLTSLSLSNCVLLGNLPDILNLPLLRVLNLGWNDNLFADFTQSNWSSSLVELDLSYCDFTGQLPSSIGQSKSLRRLVLMGNHFYGLIPTWVWNMTESVNLWSNSFTGELPSSINLSALSILTNLDLADNLLNGVIPSWLFSLPSIQQLYLGSNRLTGELPLFVNHSRLSNLQDLSLENNSLSGAIPSWLYALPSLRLLELQDNQFTGQISQLISKSLTLVDFSSNNLSGTVDLNMFSMLPNLNYLSLSRNKLSVVIIRGSANSSRSSWSGLTELGLSSCNLSKFPEFIGVQDYMFTLDLSNNRINGEIPKWMQNVAIYTLNLSYNNLIGGLEYLPTWYGKYVVDVHFNLFRGLIPTNIFNVTILFASNNRLSGEIPLSICSSIYLEMVDFSNNSLSGEIPACLFNSTYQLHVVDLHLNNLHGALPTNFGMCDQLATLDVNGNRLEGSVPQSLARCTSLEVLDLGNRKFNGTFPNWLDSLPELKVLILRNNWFQGVIKSSKTKYPFPRLQIVDLSQNKFSGKLPGRYIENFEAMSNSGPPPKGLQYMESKIHYNMGYYQNSVVLIIKGISIEYQKILTILTTVDLSNNRFIGEIPDSIGRLVSLVGLNFSHNNLRGKIPQSLGKLTALESLDLSSNMLIGEIPQQLLGLTSLEFFNVSENRLVGHIPQGKQFNTFSKDSYLENPGLCAFPLPECGGSSPPKPLAPSMTKLEDEYESTGLFEWEIVLMGYGCGLIIGLSGGFYMFSQGKPICLLRLIYRAGGYLLMERLKKHSKRQRQRRN